MPDPNPRTDTSAIDVYPGEIVAPRACWIARDSYGLPVVRPAPYGQMSAEDARALDAYTRDWLSLVETTASATLSACRARLDALDHAGSLVGAA